MTEKETFVAPEIEVIRFEEADIITLSGPNETELGS